MEYRVVIDHDATPIILENLFRLAGMPQESIETARILDRQNRIPSFDLRCRELGALRELKSKLILYQAGISLQIATTQTRIYELEEILSDKGDN